MDMDAYKVSEIIGSNRRFISPFADPCSYYIVAQDGQIDEKMIERYWELLKYAKKNADLLIQQGFQPSFYAFYGVNQKMVSSPDDMCRRLIFESFVLIFHNNNVTIGSCLSNSEFMFGHFIECEWDCDWNLIGSGIC
ncbi:MAG: hypothetical protein K2M91_04105 [Lachnospiraceae bacterium]|nr:hypothetical protein [Lachnospiraceae bacterium]